MSTENTIVVRPMGGHHVERIAAGAITPGHLVEVDSAGKFVVHNSASAVAATVFAKEDGLQGKTITDAYASGDRVFAYHARPGDIIQVIIADGETIVIGDILVSNGDGSLIKYVPETLATHAYDPLMIAEEAVTTSGATARILATTI